MRGGASLLPAQPVVVGMRVAVRDRLGTVAVIGTTRRAKGLWVGVDFDSARPGGAAKREYFYYDELRVGPVAAVIAAMCII